MKWWTYACVLKSTIYAIQLPRVIGFLLNSFDKLNAKCIFKINFVITLCGHWYCNNFQNEKLFYCYVLFHRNNVSIDKWPSLVREIVFVMIVRRLLTSKMCHYKVLRWLAQTIISFKFLKRLLDLYDHHI